MHNIIIIMRYIFNALGKCELYFKNTTGVVGNQAFSATSSGNSCKNAYCSLKKTFRSLAKDYLTTNNCTFIKIKYYDLECAKNEIPKLELYYNLIFENGVIINQELLNFVTTPKSVYSGVANQKMTTQNGTPNNNVISFVGYKTAANPALNLPQVYNETITILLEDSSCLSADMLYIDAGNGFATTTTSMTYNVTGASGVFSGFTKMTILFNNSNPNLYKRTVQFF